MNKAMHKIYTISMAILALISVVLVVVSYSSTVKIENPPYSYLDNGILILFTIDYFIRLILSKNKWHFIKQNIFDLLSIVPFNSGFYIFRLARLSRLFRILRLLRLVGLIGKLQINIKRFLKTNGFIYLIIISVTLLLVASFLYSMAEKVSFDEALWWAIATTTTVGYGDISPHTEVGKSAAVVLMLVGIGFIGMLTSSITSYFTIDENNEREDRILTKLKELEKENKQIHQELISLKLEINKHDPVSKHSKH